MRATTTRCAKPNQSFLTRCIGWQKNDRTDHPISYLNTLMTMGRESIEAIIGRRRVLFAVLVARMEDTMWQNWCVARAAWAGRKTSGMGCFLDDLRAFGINNDQ